MNVIFHTIGSIATAAVLSSTTYEQWRSFSYLGKCFIGFFVGILVHGVLDLLPHNYPLPSKIDVICSLLLLGLSFFFVRKQNLLLLLFCFGGCIFPDIIDLAPAIINKYLGISVPQIPFKIFPWHWKDFSGSIYDDSRSLESAIYHLSFFLTCAFLIYFNRKSLFKFSNN